MLCPLVQRRRALWSGACLLLVAVAGGAHAQTTPPWTADDVQASRVEVRGAADLPARPQWSADPNKLLVVFEADGEPQLSLVDGERFARIHRIAVHGELLGEPQFSGDGRHLIFASTDGWVRKVDLWNLNVVAQVRAGLQLRDLALSGDGRWLMVASASPHALVLFDDQLRLVKWFDARSRDGKQSSAVAAVRDAALRQSFIVTLQDVAELWEISYNPTAENIYDGLVHDFRMGDGVPTRGYLGVRRTRLPEALPDMVLDPMQIHALGVSGPSADGARRTHVVNLDVRRSIATLPVTGQPQLRGAGVLRRDNGESWLAIPNRAHAGIDLVDLESMQWRRSIVLPGPGRWLRTHDSSAVAWADVRSGTADSLHLVDGRRLDVVAEVRPLEITVTHLAFTRDGRHVVASVVRPDGALVVYEASSGREVARLPMRQPVGVFSVTR